jgi:hypothetical protein
LIPAKQFIAEATHAALGGRDDVALSYLRDALVRRGGERAVAAREDWIALRARWPEYRCGSKFETDVIELKALAKARAVAQV